MANAGDTILPSQHNPPLEDVAAGLTARLMRSGAGGMTGPLKAADGTVSAPSITFGTAQTSGFYKTATGFGVSIGGTLVSGFDASGVIINDQAVTYQKIQAPSAASRLLGSNANPALTITAAANNGSGLIRLTVASTSTFATGQKKIVAGVTGTTEANGRWTITVVDATHIDLQGSTFSNAYVSGGTIGGGVDEIKVGAGLALSGDTLSATLAPTLVPNYISGLTILPAGSSGSASIAAGVANDTTNTTLMQLSSNITKTSASWAVGTGNGGLDTGVVANNTWYHVWLIERPDTGVVDALYSTSASSPTMPTNYTLKRRIGTVKTDGSGNFPTYTQIGNQIFWQTPVLDVSAATIGTTASTQTLASVPSGVVVEAMLNVFAQNASGNTGVYVSPLFMVDQPPSSSANPMMSLRSPATSIGGPAGRFPVFTNTSQQIRVRADTASTTLYIAVLGWIDNRGMQ